MRAFLLFLSFVIICLVGKINSICSRCHDFGASSVTGNLTYENRTLVGCELLTFTVKHFLECFDACIVDCRCMSFNWERLQEGGGHQCQLNSETKDMKLSALIGKPGHSYHDIETTVSERKKQYLSSGACNFVQYCP